MTIGQRIKERRKQLGLTQEELAKRIGNSSRASICTVEKDREDLTTTRISKLAKALETSPAFLMGWVDDPDPKYIETEAGKLEQRIRQVDKNELIIKRKADEELNGIDPETMEWIKANPEDTKKAISLYRLTQAVGPDLNPDMWKEISTLVQSSQSHPS